MIRGKTLSPWHGNPVVVEAWRGDALESFHRGAFAIVDADGALVAATGDIERPVFPRSAVKLLQALPLVASGAADRFGLNDAELALACASHGGQPQHVGTAASVLSKAGLDDGVLECGVHWPLDEPAKLALAAAGATAPGVLHNNCSGKHAGFVCLGCHLADAQRAERRAFLSGYVRADHPVMREVAAAIEQCCGWPLAQAPQAVDGCSIPTWGLPLRQLALGFARVATGRGLDPDRAAASRRLRAAVAAAPQMVAGAGRVDTELMVCFGARVCCKVGAEGVYCAALPDLGLGLALKVDDGTSSRACEVALAALLAALGLAREPHEHALLERLSNVTLRNWRGVEVGRLAAAPELRRTLPRSAA